jgi:hypothetical protein
MGWSIDHPILSDTIQNTRAKLLDIQELPDSCFDNIQSKFPVPQKVYHLHHQSLDIYQ